MRRPHLPMSEPLPRSPPASPAGPSAYHGQVAAPLPRIPTDQGGKRHERTECGPECLGFEFLRHLNLSSIVRTYRASEIMVRDDKGAQHRRTMLPQSLDPRFQTTSRRLRPSTTRTWRQRLGAGSPVGCRAAKLPQRPPIDQLIPRSWFDVSAPQRSRR
jgi:hypothetical protein